MFVRSVGTVRKSGPVRSAVSDRSRTDLGLDGLNENFSDGAKSFEKLDRVVAIDFVQESSKSELSPRFLSCLKFALRTQEMSRFEHKERPASNTRNFLL